MPALRLALVGGGPGAFIGPVHRRAAELDARFRLTAGAFSRDLLRSQEAARAWGVEEDRAYSDWRDLLAREAGRLDAVAIVAPNHVHLPVARAALEAGLAVISDKPPTATLAEARELAGVVARTDGRYALTFTYAGYPMLREARAQVRAGTIGAVRKVVAEYPQGWLASPLEQDPAARQARWRTDPSSSGDGGAISDIGVHAFHLAEFVTGLEVSAIHARLRSVVEGRVLDDDCDVLLEFASGATGVLCATQIAAGARNGLRLRVWGETGGLDWSHERPDLLVLSPASGPEQRLHAGEPYLSPAARGATRLPPGHPEGFIEAFANLYSDFADLMLTGERPDGLPGVREGLRAMTFVDAALRSSQVRAWTVFPTAG